MYAIRSYYAENGNIIGVLGSKPPHKMKESERNKLISSEHMFIDIGAKSREEAEKMGVDRITSYNVCYTKLLRVITKTP